GNPGVHGEYISFCLTGLGNVPGAPADGDVPSAAVPMPGSNSLVVATGIGVAGSSASAPTVIYSGLGCGFPGGGQLTIGMPQNLQAGTYSIGLLLNDTPSNAGPNGTLVTQFSVK